MITYDNKHANQSDLPIWILDESNALHLPIRWTLDKLDPHPLPSRCCCLHVWDCDPNVTETPRLRVTVVVPLQRRTKVMDLYRMRTNANTSGPTLNSGSVSVPQLCVSSRQDGWENIH